MLESIRLLAYIAAFTSRLRLGTSVILTVYCLEVIQAKHRLKPRP